MVNNAKTLQDIISSRLNITQEEEEAWRSKSTQPRSLSSAEDIRNHPLFPIFEEAILQVTHGKGQRHGGVSTPFMEQPWLHYAKLHGIGFLTGQAAKKLEEAASTKQGDAFSQEMLGAIVYTAMSIMYSRMMSNRKQ